MGFRACSLGFLLASSLLLSGCGISLIGALPSNLTTGTGTGTSVNLSLTVQDVYPNNGNNWMDYVENLDTSKDIFSQPDTACTGSETGFASCLHGGQMREVPLTGVSSCSGLSMTDALGVFDWNCVVENGTATFYSIDFQQGMGLESLISSSYVSSPTSIGDTSIEATTDSGNSGWQYAEETTLAASGTLQSLSIYVPTSGAAGDLILGIYADNGSGYPGTLLAQTAEFTPSVGWNTASVILPVAVAAGTYWVSFTTDSNSFIDVYSSAGTGVWADIGSFGPMSGPFQIGGTTEAYQVSLYATLSTGSAASGWLSDSVTLSGTNNGVSYSGTSASSVWGWTNPIAALPDNSGLADTPITLYGAGTIYALASSRATEGYLFGSNQLAVVTLPEATLSYGGNSSNAGWCNGDTEIILCPTSQDFLWIEGIFDSSSGGAGTDAINAVFGYDGPTFSRLHLVTAKNSTNVGIDASETADSIFDQIDAQNNTGGGLSLTSATDNLVKQLVADSNGGGGAGLDNSLGPNSSGNVLYEINSFNNGSSGIIFNGATNNSLVQLAAANNAGTAALAMDNGTITGNTVSQVTTLNETALFLKNASQNTLNNIVTANGSGLVTQSDSNNTFSQVVSTNNSYGLYEQGSTDDQFSGVLMVGNNSTSDCYVNGGTAPGFINTTCSDSGADGSSSYTGQLSNAVLRTSRTLASSFFGKVVTTDTANSSNTSGAAASYPGTPDTFDFTHFENLFRGWGLDGSAFPSAGNLGQWTTGSGRIWDLRLLAADTVILNTTGDGSSSNSSFIAGANCPAAVDGNITATDQSARTYLLNAYEIVDPFTPGYSNTGNHNGLCEANETCIYAPNFGAYQGEGTLEPCNFVSNGGLSGITMYGYSTNGAP